MTDRQPIPETAWTDPSEEAKAYCLTLVTAKSTSPEAFANSARHDITYAQLFEHPDDYRGEVVHLSGRLKRVAALAAPKLVRDDIPTVYESWLFDVQQYGANPFCVLLTDLPEGIHAGAELDVPATVDAYFFKRYRYRAGDGWRDAPLFIGRTIRAEAPAAALNWDLNAIFSGNLVWALAILFGGTVGSLLALHWWYRRGDARLRRRLAAARALCLPEPDAAAEPPRLLENGVPGA